MISASSLVLTLVAEVFAPLSEGPGKVDQLIAMLKSPDAVVREDAVVALGRMGPSASGAVPALGAALRYQGENDVPARAAWALGEIGTAAIPALIKSLADNNQVVRDPVILALARIGAPAVPALIDAAGAKDRFMQEAATEALGDIGPTAKEAVPCLVDALRKKRSPEAAVVALGKIGPVTEEVVPAIIEALGDESRFVRLSATSAMETLGVAGLRAVPVLIRRLADDDGATRAGAARALGSMGPDAREAIPALKGALDDANKYVGREVNDALRKIEGW